METESTAIPPGFGIRFYFRTLTALMENPRRFFSELPNEIVLTQPLGFLFVSSVFFAVVSAMGSMSPRPLLMCGIFFINAIGMAFIAAWVGYVVMALTVGRRATFRRLLTIYAYASGVTLLASWLPFFIWLTEPWKWILLIIGLVKGCGFRWMQAILVVAGSVFIVVLFFWSLGPVIVQMRGLME